MTTKAQYAKWCNKLVEGNNILEKLFKALHKDSFTDEKSFWIYGGEEE